MSKERKLLYKLGDFEVYEDSKFKIGHKRDDDAPKEFVEMGWSKLPGVGDSISAPFVKSNSHPDGGQYDLGFEETSVHYKYKQDEAKTIVANLVKNVLKPYAKQVNIPESTLRGDLAYYDKYTFRFDEDDIFDMTFPEQRFNFYLMILRGKIAHSSNYNSSEYSEAKFVAQDLIGERKHKDTVVREKAQATRIFTELIETKRSFLIDVFDYMDSNSISKEVDNDIIYEYFWDVVLPQTDARGKFLAAYEKSEEEIRLYSIVKSKLRKSSSGFEKIGEVIFYGDIELGTSIANAAEAINSSDNEDLKNLKKTLMLDED